MAVALTETRMSGEPCEHFVVLNVPVIRILSAHRQPTNSEKCTYLLEEEDGRPCYDI
jgi:hypothetical protein